MKLLSLNFTSVFYSIVCLGLLSSCGGGGGAAGGGTSSVSQAVASSSAVAVSSSSRSSSMSVSAASSVSSANISSSGVSFSTSSVSVSSSSSSTLSSSSVSSSFVSSSSTSSAISNSSISFVLQASGLIDGNSTAWEQARDVAVDDLGYIYVVGGVSSATGFPITVGAYDTTYNNVNSASADTSYTGQNELGNQGATDAFVMKLNPQGNVVWATYLGGPNYDRAYAVEVDAAHNVYVGGRAGRGFPTTAGTVQPIFAGDSVGNGEYGKQDGFVAKISADGSQLLWATYFGDAGGSIVRDIDIDAQNRVHIAAPNVIASDMDRFVTAGAAQTTRRGYEDTFYARLSPNGNAVEYGTYIGGVDNTGAFSANTTVRALPDGTAYILTNEKGAGAPTTANVFQPNYAGNLDLIIAKFSPVGNGGKMDACTYLGGTGDDFLDTHHLAISPTGNVIVTAGTNSANYPVTYSSNFNSSGKAEIAVSVLSADLTTLIYSRIIGGSAGDSSEGIDVDAAGNIYITGSTGSSDLPVTQGALHNTDVPNEREGFHLIYSPDLSQVKYFSYDNIPGEYANRSSTVGANGLWYVVGATWHMNPFPSTGSFDSVINGTYAAFFQIFQVNP